MTKPQILVDRVSHYYRPQRGRSVRALEDVSLGVESREFIAHLGPSGCGKSTLLYLIGGFLPTEEGQIIVDGKKVTRPGSDRGIVFQHFALFPWKTVRENVLYGLERARIPRAEREERVRNYIALVGLTGFEDSYPSQLSGGMKQHANRAEFKRGGEAWNMVDLNTRRSRGGRSSLCRAARGSRCGSRRTSSISTTTSRRSR